MNKDKLNVPILFQKLKQYETVDTRFTKVKIWLCHTGKNLNGSIFTKDVLQNAIPSLANTPILGFIEDNSMGEKDFSDHRSEITRNEDSRWEFKYVGKAWGMIGETNNAQFEMRLCDDGIEREYLTVEGLLWNKLTDSIDIFNRDIIKSQSMEIHDDALGYEDEEGYFVFQNFKFYGACCLGIDVEPAMVNSTIELQFTADDYKKEISRKMEEFKLFFQKDEEMERSEILTEETKVEEVVVDKTEFEENTESTETTQETPVEETVKEEEKTEFTEEEKKEDKFTKVFELSHDDIRSKIYEVLSYNAYIVQVYDDYLIYEDYTKDGYKHFKANYIKTDDEVSVDEANRIEVRIAYLTEEEESELEAMRNKVTLFEKQVEELSSSLSEYQAKERQGQETELFEKYSELEGIQEFEDIKSKTNEFSTIEDMEKEIALVFVKNRDKINFSKQEVTKNKFEFEEEKKTSKYGNLFEKYSK